MRRTKLWNTKMLPFGAYRSNHESKRKPISEQREVPFHSEYQTICTKFKDINQKYFQAAVMPALRVSFNERIAMYKDAYDHMHGILSRLMDEQQRAFDQLFSSIRSTGSVDIELFKQVAGNKDAKKLEWIRDSIIASRSISFAVQEAQVRSKRYGSPEHQHARLLLNAEKWKQAYLHANADWMPELLQRMNNAIENFMVAKYAEQKIMPQFRGPTEATVYVHSLDDNVSPHFLVTAFETFIRGCDESISSIIDSLSDEVEEKITYEIPLTIANSVLETAYGNENWFNMVLTMSQNIPEAERLFREMYAKVLSS